MKKNKCFPILLTLLSSLSCVTNARGAVKLEKDIISNNEDVILSNEGKKYFEELMKSRNSKKIENQEIKVSNPNAGNYTQATEMEKFLGFSTPAAAAITFGLLSKIVLASESQTQEDNSNDYKLAADSFNFPMTLLSIKSLICILDGLEYGQKDSDMDNTVPVPPKQTNIMNGKWNKVKWADYGYANDRFLCVVQRAAVHGKLDVEVIESELKEWMKENNFDHLSNDQLKMKWNNINIRYREIIKAVCNGQFYRSSKPALGDFVNKLADGEPLTNTNPTRIVGKGGTDGVFGVYKREDNNVLALKHVDT